jgi:hypothetical protein
MSSTLFGRGTHTQIGAMHRAETVNRELAEIRALLEEVKLIPDTVRELKEAVIDMRQRLNMMNVPDLVAPVKQEQLDELESKIEALKVLQAPQVTTANLQALEKRLTKRITDSLSAPQSDQPQKSASPSAESSAHAP